MNEQFSRSINLSIKKLAGTFNQQAIVFTTGLIQTVDLNSRSCDVLIDHDVIINCKLMAAIGDGVLFVPSVDSTVLVTYSTYNDAYVLMASDLDVISLKGNELGGLVKVIDLTTKLNNLENDLNNIKQAFNSWTPVPNDGGAALKAASSTWAGSNITVTQRSDIENQNVTHGN